MNKAVTRAEHIDPALKAAGWGVVEGSQIRRDYPITFRRLEGKMQPQVTSSAACARTCGFKLRADFTNQKI